MVVDKVKPIASTDRLPSHSSLPNNSEVQIEMGILQELRIPHGILIVAEGCPSWFFKSVKIFLRSSLSIKEELKAVGSAENLIIEADLDLILLAWF